MRQGVERLRSLLLRIVLVGVPLLLSAAAINEASASPMRFSDAKPFLVDSPYWLISLNPLIVAALPFAFGLWAAWSVFWQMRGPYSVSPPMVGLGIFGMLIFSAALWRISEQAVDSRFHYYGLAAGANGSLIFTLFGSVVFGGCLFGFVYLYRRAFVAEGPRVFDRRPDEPDAIGTVMREMAPLGRTHALEPSRRRQTALIGSKA